MKFSDISVPDIYKSSADFRFFLQWFEHALEIYKHDTENFLDLYDALRCPDHLLWCLADTIGFKYDDRMPVAYNRLILLYFMSMIRLKGSKDGVTLAAEVNLAQFRILEKAITGYYEADEAGNPVYVEPEDILGSRLEDTNIPVNSAYVTPHTEDGYIEVVYFSSRKPTDCCLEYVRPLGMYLFDFSGVRYDARTKISIDARLTNINNRLMSIGATHVGHYSREDYARIQKNRNRNVDELAGQSADATHSRKPVYYRNSVYEGQPDTRIDPGYRTLYSLQLANNDHIVNSLVKDPDTGKSNPPEKIFSIGFNPVDISTGTSKPILKPEYSDNPLWNLRYDAGTDREITEETYVLDPERQSTTTSPKPAVNPVMMNVGDAMALDSANTEYIRRDDEGNYSIERE